MAKRIRRNALTDMRAVLAYVLEDIPRTIQDDTRGAMLYTQYRAYRDVASMAGMAPVINVRRAARELYDKLVIPAVMPIYVLYDGDLNLVSPRQVRVYYQAVQNAMAKISGFTPQEFKL